jgi:D-amino-acid oxidase
MIPIHWLSCEADGLITPNWHVVPFGFRPLSAKTLKTLSDEHNRVYTVGFQYISFCCEPTKFLPYLFKRFTAAGGQFQKKKVFSLDEFKDYDLIINCSGLGSRELLGDQKSHAIRGQVARVKAPWIYHVMLDNSDDGTYVIPNTSTVILGGTHQFNDYNLQISKPDSAFIFNGCRQMFPSLANAPTALEWVGLRPGREEVRLDTEFRENAPTVINNYGHG